MTIPKGKGLTFGTMDVLWDVVCSMAALIPDPQDPKIDDWPCENRADRVELQNAYRNVKGLLGALEEENPTWRKK